MNEPRLSISFSGEASESFADRISNMRGWYVRITPQDGEPFDAEIVTGEGEVEGEGGWYDAVTYLDVDEETGLALPDATEKTVRVTDVFVY